jgi:RND family efflux transporter MFP subunit
MKNSLLMFLLISLFSCSEKKQHPAAPEQLPVITISTGTATTYENYPASVEGVLNVEIRPQVTGILDHIFVDDGAFVTKGESLFQINEAPFQEKLNNALASLQSEKGSLANTQIEIDKLTPLVQNKVIADYQLKTAIAAREIALGNVEQAKADIATARINLSYTLIKAPASGYIGRLLRKQGSLIGPADSSPLTELSDVHVIHVFFAMGEADFIRFKDQYPGRTLADKIKQLPSVELIMADDSAYSLEGKIDVINGQFDKNTGAITFRATFPNQDGLLRSGNTCKIRLGLAYARELIVPQSSTQEMQDQTFVFTVNDSNKVAKKTIMVMGKSGTNYLVDPGSKDGLKAGDKIVYNGFDHLHEGDAINPQPVTGISLVKN